MIPSGKEALKALLISLAVLALLAVAFGAMADAHYDGPFANPMPPGAPRNFLSFRSPVVYAYAEFFAVPIAIYWLIVAFRRQAFINARFANATYLGSFAVLVALWTDSILDDYYHASLFCPFGGEPVNAIDIGWHCLSAFYAREIILPLAMLLLIVISLVLRLWPRRFPRSDQS